MSLPEFRHSIIENSFSLVRDTAAPLPLQLVRAVPHAPHPPEKPRHLVLICDGEELALDLLEHHLTGAGYEVMRAADGGAAMQCLAERTPAVVILAVMTRVLSGIEVLQRIRESPTQGHLPVMMLTRRDSEEDVVEALRLGASDYITKPFMVGEVLERISKHITPYEHPLDTHVHDLAA